MAYDAGAAARCARPHGSARCDACKGSARVRVLQLPFADASAHLPSVSHVRLDGRVAVARRGELVERFNSDPSIDLMLLTTAVGGLGLSLTSARHGPRVHHVMIEYTIRE